MQIIIPFKTPSVNHLYYHFRNAKILTKEARELQKQIKEICPKECYIKERLLKVVVEIYEDWYFKNGNVAKKDVSNREKFLIDSVFSALDLDDKFIFEQSLKKIQSETEEKAVITIEVLDASS
jgi:hypothetical protein